MADYIERSVAIDANCSRCHPEFCLHECDTVKDIRAIPSADVVERKKGKWINDGFYADGHSYFVFRCSECDHSTLGTQLGITGYHFCPNCGAEMESE